MANNWLRLWHDMPNDPKWRTIARASKQPLALVQAVYLHLLVDASRNVTRGVTTVTVEDLASALDADEPQIEAILGAMQGRVLDGDRLSGWEARQPAREDLGDPQTGAKSAAQRKREQRERARKQVPQPACHDVSRNVTTDKDKDTEITLSHTPAQARETLAAAAEPPAPASLPAAGPHPMTLEWVPDQRRLKALAVRAGLPLTLFAQEAISGFVIHHAAKGLTKTSAEWHAALVIWVKRDAEQARSQAARVVSFPAQRRANGPNFDDTSWGDDLGDL